VRAPATTHPPPSSGDTRAIAGALLAKLDGDPLPGAGAHLLVSHGEPAGWRFPVRDGALLGRGKRADVALADPAASRCHARLLVSARRLALEDLGSKNGLTVNGRATSGKTVTLRHGDRIAIGETTLIVERDAGYPSARSDRARADGSTAPAVPRPPPPTQVEAPPDGAPPRRDRVTALAAGALLAAAALCALAGLV
jgi:predicted component of type VI protein secretion system